MHVNDSIYVAWQLVLGTTWRFCIWTVLRFLSCSGAVPVVVLSAETVLLCCNTSCSAPETENNNNYCTYTVYSGGFREIK